MLIANCLYADYHGVLMLSSMSIYWVSHFLIVMLNAIRLSVSMTWCHHSDCCYADYHSVLMLCSMSIYWVLHFWIVMQNDIRLSVFISGCHHSDCHYADCRSVLMSCSLLICWVSHFLIVTQNAIRLNVFISGCHHSYCHYADCCGILGTKSQSSYQFMVGERCWPLHGGSNNFIFLFFHRKLCNKTIPHLLIVCTPSCFLWLRGKKNWNKKNCLFFR